jgi:cyclopropane-fatty-acyl-phospholipid synthase
MDRLLRLALDRLIRTGTLRLTTAAGSTFALGNRTGAPAAIRLTNRFTERAILLDPELKFGEGYMDGTVVIEQGSIADVLAILLNQPVGPPFWARMQWLWRYPRRRLMQFNPRRRARLNVAHHYDLDGQLYSLSSMPTGSTAAPTSKPSTGRSTMPNSPSGVTWRRNC